MTQHNILLCNTFTGTLLLAIRQFVGQS